MSYAENTAVTSERSRAEIERTLSRYGADSFVYGWDRGMAMVGFRVNTRQVKFLIPLPDRNDKEFKYTPARGQRRSDSQAEAAYEQAVKQKWRALSLVVKAKLEAVESGITTFDEEFMAHIVLPNGQTTGEVMVPQIEEAYATGKMPAMLPQLGSGS